VGGPQLVGLAAGEHGVGPQVGLEVPVAERLVHVGRQPADVRESVAGILRDRLD